MRELLYEPLVKKEDIIVSFTDDFILDKGMKISVPNQYIAIVFDNKKIAFRIEPCVSKSIFKEYGKSFLGHEMKIAFIHVKSIPDIIWGFGNIQVNNERLQEAYRVGANGKLKIEIGDYGKLVNYFEQYKEVSIDTIKNCILTEIKMIGTSIISQYFSNSNVSVFEINSLIENIRNEMLQRLSNEDSIKNLGIKISSIIMNQIYVNEDDLELIRNRINFESTKKASISINETKIADIEKEFDKLSQKLTEKVFIEIAESEKRREEYNKQQIAEELQKSQKEMLDAITGKISDQLDEFSKNISMGLDEKIQEMLPLQDNAKKEYISRIDLTAENIINRSKNDEELIPAAAMMYTNIEENLITKFGLKHENEKFVIDYNEYLDIVEKAKIEDKYLLKKKNSDGSFTTIDARVVKYDKNGLPVLVEMMPIVRFMKAGLSVEDTKKAAEMWSVLNKIRHKSRENVQTLDELFAKLNMTRKEYLLDTLKFYKKLGLYTKD